MLEDQIPTIIDYIVDGSTRIISLPFSPVGPVSPVAPVLPFSPLGSISPVGPGGPLAPLMPSRPVGPLAPWTPLNPVAPVTPEGPDSPVGPTEPDGPSGPVCPKPVTPGGPEIHKIPDWREVHYSFSVPSSLSVYKSWLITATLLLWFKMLQSWSRWCRISGQICTTKKVQDVKCLHKKTVT